MNILRDLYPNVCTLDAYLTQLFEQEICTNSEQKNTNSWWIHFDDTLEFRLLLRCTLVAYSERPQPIARPLSTTITTVHHAATHTKWISHILAKLVMKIDEDELSCTEARIKTLSQEYMRCHQDQRSLINELKSMPWRILSQRIGKKAFEHLLLKVTLFRALPNQCIYQLWGKSVAQEIPSAKSNQKISTLKRYIYNIDRYVNGINKYK
ncbi:hypothetical protein BDF19DRAFT_285550 [Syncephalis fuscata]|nr:hypothetical protein BDF19DRAFT_285550 [Syncephalis fuscata]